MGRKVLLGIFAVALVAAPAFAHAQAEQGFYLGGSVGQAKAKEFCDTDGVAGLTVANCDNSATTWKAFIGYRIHRNFAVEGTFLKTDDFTASGTITGIPFSGSADGQAFGVAVMGVLPVGSMDLFAKLGFLSTDAETRVSAGGQTFTFGDDETEAHFGIGAIYNFGRNWGVRAEWEKTNKSKLEVWSIGLQYRF